MNIFISGGAKNGKSYFAQKKAQEISRRENRPLYYIATMIPRDEEDEARIKRHLKEREGWGFITLELPGNICGCLDEGKVDPNGSFLLDSVTAILANEMFKDGRVFLDAPERVADDLLTFAERTGNVVFVSDYIYNDYPEEDSSAKNDCSETDNYTEVYRKGLAYIDKKLAEACDSVIEISAGIPTVHK